MTVMQAVRGIVSMRGSPDAAASQVSELLWGERFAVEAVADGWAGGRSLHDDYPGFVRAEALAPVAAPPTHRVAALSAFVYGEPGLKKPPLDCLHLGSPVTVVGAEKVWRRLAEGGWIAAVALQTLDARGPDPVATALRFLGAPYLWGGRTVRGLDCSGLVQIALAASGVAAPRDSHQQEAAVGAALAPGEAPSRGDLVFFPKHVGLMVDADHVLHANAARMSVTVDPLAEVVARVEAAEGRGVTARRRVAR